MQQYDIGKIPFSRYGSYFAVSEDGAAKTYYLRDLHGGDEAPSNLYRIHIEDHGPEDLELTRSEAELCIQSRLHEGARLKIAMDKDTVHFLAEYMDYRLEAVGGKYDTLVPLSGTQCEHHLYEKQRKIMFTALHGRMEVQQEWNIIGSKDAAVVCRPCQSNKSSKNSKNIYRPYAGLEKDVLGDGSYSHMVLESYKTVWKEKVYPPYEEVRDRSAQECAAWAASFPGREAQEGKGGAPGFQDSHDLACYLTWANVVCAEGQLCHDAMYMSKNWMFNIWSWDNCFGAVALSAAYPRMALGQLEIFFHCQDESGVYPDYVNEAFASYNCAKPPVFAWAYDRMCEINPWFKQEEVMREVYESVSRVTDYWTRYRKNPGAEFPVYYHGNDSGWDNASVFHQGFPVESPDLAAFLIYQMDSLSRMAAGLGRESEAEGWKLQADDWYERFIRRFYHQGRFYAYYTPEGTRITEGNSLLMYLPLLIAYRMEEGMVDWLAGQLAEQFEAPYGLSTEAAASPYYRRGGYWLGPVWAPVTYLFIDALRRCGQGRMAYRLADKFCRATQIGLMAENYDPFTGEDYDDPAFSWSSCVLLQLLREMDMGILLKG